MRRLFHAAVGRALRILHGFRYPVGHNSAGSRPIISILKPQLPAGAFYPLSRERVDEAPLSCRCRACTSYSPRFSLPSRPQLSGFSTDHFDIETTASSGCVLPTLARTPGLGASFMPLSGVHFV